MKHIRLSTSLCLALLASTPWAAAQTTKDFVLGRIATPARTTPAPAGRPNGTPSDDAMVVRVLVESPNGKLTPRAANASFRTGDRFRVRMQASRDGTVALYNTKPSGELVTVPLWKGQIRRGAETLSPRLKLEGRSGVDQLHVVLEPLQEPAPASWLANILRGVGIGKDIRLDVENTASDTYLLGSPGRGLVTTLRISHR